MNKKELLSIVSTQPPASSVRTSKVNALVSKNIEARAFVSGLQFYEKYKDRIESGELSPDIISSIIVNKFDANPLRLRTVDPLYHMVQGAPIFLVYTGTEFTWETEDFIPLSSEEISYISLLPERVTAMTNLLEKYNKLRQVEMKNDVESMESSEEYKKNLQDAKDWLVQEFKYNLSHI